MALYSINENTLQPITEKVFRPEKDIQKLVESNLTELLALQK